MLSEEELQQVRNVVMDMLNRDLLPEFINSVGSVRPSSITPIDEAGATASDGDVLTFDAALGFPVFK